eukprot:Ihof_evm1s426 gene=Ihof_evmTU1s426
MSKKYFSGSKPQGTAVEGQLWAQSKGSEKCLFMNSEMRVVPKTEPFEHELVISRVFEEGEEKQPDEPARYVFPIDISLLLILYNDKDKQWFQWHSRQGHLYAFKISSHDDTIQTFARQAYNAIYEKVHQVSCNQASNNDLVAIQQEIEDRLSQPNKKDDSIKKTNEVPKAPQKQPQVVTQPESNRPVSNRPVSSTPAKPAKPATPPGRVAVTMEGTPRYSCKASLYSYDCNSRRFILQADNCDLKVNDVGHYTAVLYMVAPDGQVLLDQSCSSDMNLFWQPEHLSVIWVRYEEGMPYTWSVKLNERESYDAFVTCITETCYERTHQEPMSKNLKDEDGLNYVRRMCYDVQEMDEDSEEEKRVESTSEDDQSEDEDEGTYLDNAMRDMNINVKGKNGNLCMGVMHNRSFVSRGDNIGVFRNNAQENKMEFVTNIKGLTDLNGDKLVPSQLMLHKEDSKMMMMKPNENKKIFVMDLERAQIVDEWKTHELIGVSDICPREKYAQATNTDLMVGANRNRIMLMDGRLKGDKVVESQSYAYTGSKPELQCIATTDNGYLVVGSQLGDIRMFNKLEMKAKTLLPGLGDPIIGIDVSADGKWVLATCKTYIIVIGTESTDQKYTGFTKSISRQKPIPIILKVKPEHVAVMGCKVEFTPAKFNTGDMGEHYIISGMGPYVLQWPFDRVKRRYTQDYTIKR